MDKKLEEIFIFKKEIKFLALLFILVFLIGTVGYSLINNVNLLQGFILTIETLAFLHKEEFGIARVLQIFLLLFGAITIWFTVWAALGLSLEGHFQKYFYGVKNMDRLKKIKNHYIICGAGRVGQNIAILLKEDKKDFVLVEKDLEVAKEMEEKGFLTFRGASVEEETLVQAGIKRAKFLIACTGDDAKNVLITLNAKELNPDIIIIARANDEIMVKKLKRAGAKHVFLPELIGAKEAFRELAVYK